MARGTSVSPFVIVLTADERGELERRAGCHTASYARVVRAKVVLFAADWIGERGDRRPLRYQPPGGAPLA